MAGYTDEPLLHIVLPDDRCYLRSDKLEIDIDSNDNLIGIDKSTNESFIISEPSSKGQVLDHIHQYNTEYDVPSVIVVDVHHNFNIANAEDMENLQDILNLR